MQGHLEQQKHMRQHWLSRPPLPDGQDLRIRQALGAWWVVMQRRQRPEGGAGVGAADVVPGSVERPQTPPW